MYSMRENSTNESTHSSCLLSFVNDISRHMFFQHTNCSDLPQVDTYCTMAKTTGTGTARIQPCKNKPTWIVAASIPFLEVATTNQSEHWNTSKHDWLLHTSLLCFSSQMKARLKDMKIFGSYFKFGSSNMATKSAWQGTAGLPCCFGGWSVATAWPAPAGSSSSFKPSSTSGPAISPFCFFLFFLVFDAFALADFPVLLFSVLAGLDGHSSSSPAVVAKGATGSTCLAKESQTNCGNWSSLARAGVGTGRLASVLFFPVETFSSLLPKRSFKRFCKPLQSKLGRSSAGARVLRSSWEAERDDPSETALSVGEPGCSPAWKQRCFNSFKAWVLALFGVSNHNLRNFDVHFRRPKPIFSDQSSELLGWSQPAQASGWCKSSRWLLPRYLLIDEFHQVQQKSRQRWPAARSRKHTHTQIHLRKCQ